MTNLDLIRAGKVTASRVPAILGLSPYRSSEDALRDAVREFFWDEPEFTGNVATEWGNEHEAQAIEAYEWLRGVVVSATGEHQQTVIHPTYEWLAATPDGLVADGTVEVKCPYRATYSSIEQRPDHWVQIQIALACTGLSWCDYLVWFPEGLVPPQRVEADPLWFAANLPVLQVWHDRLVEIVSDPDLARPYREPLVDVRTDRDWADAAVEYLELRQAADWASQELEQAKARLVELADGKSARGSGVFVVKSERKGSVSYQRALKKFAPEIGDDDLEPFRGKSSTSFAVRRTAETKEQQ